MPVLYCIVLFTSIFTIDIQHMIKITNMWDLPKFVLLNRYSYILKGDFYSTLDV